MKSRPETASIEFGATSSKPSSAASISPVGVEVDARQRAGAERQPPGLAPGVGEAPPVALEHPEVRQQVMAEVDGLRALQVRVAGHRPWPRARAPARAAPSSAPRPSRRRRASRRLAREHRQVGDDLVVARAGRVQPAPDRPRQLRQAPLDRHVDVLVVRARTGSARSASSAATASSPASSASRSSLGDDPPRGQHPRVGARLRDVLRPQPPVEGDRGVQALEVRVLGLVEARHAAAVYAASWPSTDRSSSATRATCPSLDLREERQRERARGDVLADGELAGAVPEALAVEAHQVDRRQVGLALDPSRRQRPDRSRRGRLRAGSCTTNTNQPRPSPPRSGQGSSRPSMLGERLAVERRRARLARRASPPSRSSCARPSAQAISDSR